ncbi:hypothetical protein GX441_06780 [bacterium]|nr:hypothetical protein [bacterium]
MKKGIHTILAALTLFSGAAVGQPGPYPVIFLHGTKKTHSTTEGWTTWDRTDDYSAMDEILLENAWGFSGAHQTNCDKNTVLQSESDKRVIYNFAFYNPNANNPGTIGSVYGRFTPTYGPAASQYAQNSDATTGA